VEMRSASTTFSFAGSGEFPSTYFVHSLDVVLKMTDIPFLFVTAQFLRSSNLFQTEKFALYELREHFETFTERRDQCIRSLNSLRSSLKLLNVGGDGGSVTSTSSMVNSRHHELELYKCLHKLFFQLLIMIEKLYHMIQMIQQSSNSQEYDLSPAVCSLQRDLLESSLDMPPEVVNVRNVDQHSDSLVLYLANKQFRSSLSLLHSLRNQYGSDFFGCCDHMDIDVLLIQFCRSHTLRTWAIIGSLSSLQQICSQLKEINIQWSGLVRNLIPEPPLGSTTGGSEAGSRAYSRYAVGPRASFNSTTSEAIFNSPP